MSKQFKTPIAPPALSSDPSGDVTGAIYYNTTVGALKIFNGTTWSVLTGAGGGGGESTSIQVLDSAPSSPTQGKIYFDRSEKTIKIYNDSIWYDVAGPKELLDHIHYADNRVRYVDYGQYVSETLIVMDGGTSNSVFTGDIINGGNS
jgi:hypothetical protein